MAKKITWENLLFIILSIMFVVGMGLLIAVTFGERKTIRYSLGVDSNERLTITKEIDWYRDDELPLDRSTTYPEAIRLVDSLNKTLK